jgi:diguanylate cyclase (GGDEF)-like protein
MADLDHLKEYNERNGHLRGSDLLRRVAVVVRGSVRPGDIVSKYGGDEFVLILPDTGAGVGRTVGERVCSAVAALEFPGAIRGAVTLSIGLAEFPEDGASVAELLEAADRALFAAKRLGRNRVEAAALAA